MSHTFDYIIKNRVNCPKSIECNVVQLVGCGKIVTL